MNKKLQVFVSSTYTDLIEERQVAVQAILDADHIPAGMELFKSGNRSQLDTIYKWIDESDIYMLILGGRYGSIEPNSGKSYTQLEYEYAINNDIPVFSVVLTNKFLHYKASYVDEDKIFEKNNISKYQEFKNLVTSKIVREVDTLDKISIAIHTTLKDFLNDTSLNLIGWVKNANFPTPNNIDINMAQILVENSTLLKEKITNLETIRRLKNENEMLSQKIDSLNSILYQGNNNSLLTTETPINEDFRKLLLSRLTFLINKRAILLDKCEKAPKILPSETL